MLSNLISHYQPSPLSQETTGASEKSQPSAAHSHTGNLEDTNQKEGFATQAGDYRPSDKALLISALALDYDTNNLNAQSMGALNSELLDLGLISQKESMLLMRVSAQMPILDQDTLPYQSRQALDQLNRLMENLATARQSMSSVQQPRSITV